MLFVSALLAGASFWPMSHLLAPSAGLVVWKGSGVALLALWALVVARDGAGRLLALVLALGASGDVLLETSGLSVGASAFLAGHVLAVILYGARRRAGAGLIGLLIALVVPPAAWLLTHSAAVLLYATGLGAMAGAAWASRFPRHLVALGAMMFVVSDLLIFARLGVLRDSIIPALLVWPLYFGGQALIAWGAGRMLAADSD